MAVAGPEIVKNGLIFHVDASDFTSYPRAGNSILDLSGNEINGTLSNVSFLEDGGGCIDFAGASNSYVDFGSPDTIIGAELTAGFSLEIWAKSTSVGAQMMMENGSDWSTNTFYFGHQNDTQIDFFVCSTGSQYDAIDSAFNYASYLNQWIHYVGRWTPGSRVELFVNGVKDTGSNRGSARTVLQDGNTPLRWGVRGTAGGYPFAGYIGMTRMYNRPLTLNEIRKNYYASKDRFQR